MAYTTRFLRRDAFSSPEISCSGLGGRISQRPIANEKDLETFLHNSVEHPVRSILHQLKEVNQVQSVYGIGGGIVFENHPRAVSDVAEEVIDREN